MLYPMDSIIIICHQHANVSYMAFGLQQFSFIITSKGIEIIEIEGPYITGNLGSDSRRY